MHDNFLAGSSDFVEFGLLSDRFRVPLKAQLVIFTLHVIYDPYKCWYFFSFRKSQSVSCPFLNQSSLSYLELSSRDTRVVSIFSLTYIQYIFIRYTSYFTICQATY